jgi:hypothetical protein
VRSHYQIIGGSRGSEHCGHSGGSGVAGQQSGLARPPRATESALAVRVSDARGNSLKLRLVIHAAEAGAQSSRDLRMVRDAQAVVERLWADWRWRSEVGGIGAEDSESLGRGTVRFGTNLGSSKWLAPRSRGVFLDRPLVAGTVPRIGCEDSRT